MKVKEKIIKIRLSLDRIFMQLDTLSLVCTGNYEIFL